MNSSRQASGDSSVSPVLQDEIVCPDGFAEISINVGLAAPGPGRAHPSPAEVRQDILDKFTQRFPDCHCSQGKHLLSMDNEVCRCAENLRPPKRRGTAEAVSSTLATQSTTSDAEPALVCLQSKCSFSHNVDVMERNAPTVFKGTKLVAEGCPVHKMVYCIQATCYCRVPQYEKRQDSGVETVYVCPHATTLECVDGQCSCKTFVTTGGVTRVTQFRPVVITGGVSGIIPPPSSHPCPADVPLNCQRGYCYCQHTISPMAKRTINSSAHMDESEQPRYEERPILIHPFII